MLRIFLGGGLVALAASVWGQEAYAVRGGSGPLLWVAGSVAPGLDASNLKQLAWSKDGKSLAVLAADGVLRVVRLDGQSQEVARPVSRFRWSPTSESLAFESQGGIWTYEPGQAPVRVLDGESVAWSPDGSRIAYSAKGSVWISLANGTLGRRVANGRSARALDWSADGRQLAFQDKGLASKPGGIFVVGANRVGARKIAEGKADRVEFSPDGRRLLVEEKDATRLYDLEQKGAIRLAPEGKNWRWIGSKTLEGLVGLSPVQAEWPSGTLSPLAKPSNLPEGMVENWARATKILISNDLLTKGPFATAAKPVPNHLRIQGFVESVDPLNGKFTLSVGTTLNYQGWETNLSTAVAQRLIVPPSARENDGTGRYSPLRIMNIRPDQEVSVVVRADALSMLEELEVAEVWIAEDKRELGITSEGPRLQGLPLAHDGVSPEKPVIPIVYPVAGKNSVQDWWLASRGGGTRRHLGQDIMAPKMTPLVACFDGVIFLGRGGKNGHYTMTIRGDNGWTANYYHVNNDTPGTDDGMGGDQYAFAPGLESGQRVFAGQFIGYVGDSGNAENTPPHLHFELWDQVTGGVVNAYPSLMAASQITQPLAQMVSPELRPRKGEQRMDGIVRLVDQGRKVVQIDVTAVMKDGKRTASVGSKKMWVKLGAKIPMFVRGHEDLKVGFEEIREGLEMTIMLPASLKGVSVSPRLAAFAVAG